jgi:hypothetical protein
VWVNGSIGGWLFGSIVWFGWFAGFRGPGKQTLPTVATVPQGRGREDSRGSTYLLRGWDLFRSIGLCDAWLAESCDPSICVSRVGFRRWSTPAGHWRNPAGDWECSDDRQGSLTGVRRRRHVGSFFESRNSAILHRGSLTYAHTRVQANVYDGLRNYYSYYTNP